jgi:hypothetical protein
MESLKRQGEQLKIYGKFRSDFQEFANHDLTSLTFLPPARAAEGQLDPVYLYVRVS